MNFELYDRLTAAQLPDVVELIVRLEVEIQRKEHELEEERRWSRISRKKDDAYSSLANRLLGNEIDLDRYKAVLSMVLRGFDVDFNDDTDFEKFYQENFED